MSTHTIKNRLNRISTLLDPGLAVETTPAPGRREILDQLERGEINAQQAVEALKR